jgi:hypothetical protein
MVMSRKWLDLKHNPIENEAGAEGIPTAVNIGRPYGKSRENKANSEGGL